MSKIELKHIDKYYGKNHVLKDVNLTIADGDFMTLLGPSGCGKTTTLRVVSGLEKPQGGTIHMDDKEVVNAAEAYFAPPSERGLNLVFQSYALWPHMTAVSYTHLDVYKRQVLHLPGGDSLILRSSIVHVAAHRCMRGRCGCRAAGCS